jgi:hypothetical protein
MACINLKLADLGRVVWTRFKHNGPVTVAKFPLTISPKIRPHPKSTLHTRYTPLAHRTMRRAAAVGEEREAMPRLQRRSRSRSGSSSRSHRPCRQRRCRRLAAVLLLLAMAVVPLHAQAPTTTAEAPAAAVACFATLGAVNSDMELELIRIRNGAPPQTAYMYPLCPNTVFDASLAPLRPLLNNAMIVCGVDGQRSNRCVILGGSVQVAILDSLVDGYPLQELSFMGLTFSGFTSASAGGIGTSIAAMASSVTMATFTDCAWQVRTHENALFSSSTMAFNLRSLVLVYPS